MNLMSLILFFFQLCVLLPFFTNAAYPQDRIYISSFNQSFYLQNETYTFQLIPDFEVPLSVLRHTIYTGSTNTVVTLGKRAIMQNQGHLYEVSPEDYEHLYHIMDGDVPEVVRVNNKKRSLPPLSSEGMKVIQLSPKVAFFHTYSDQSQKRQSDGSNSVATDICIHVPGFTTCDNTPDINSFKQALQASVDEIHSELDSYEKTDNARMDVLQTTLNTQKNMISAMLTTISQLNELVGQVSSSIQVNAAQIADGDYQAHSQINFLKMMTNTLLKYSNALASSDPRTVVAQPSLTKLFSGYMTTLAWLTNSTYEPIVDSRVFDWQETILPSQTIQNTSTNPCLAQQMCQVPTSMSVNARVTVFTAIMNAACVFPSNPPSYPTIPACIPPGSVKLESDGKLNWIYGPFHKNHYGIYPVTVTTDGSTMTSTYVIQQVVQPSPLFTVGGNQSITFGLVGNTMSYCVQFLGYTMLASVQTNSLLNGIAPTYVDPSNCDDFRLLEGSISNTIYSLYAESEDVIIPFYSNCDIGPLVNDLNNLLGSSIPSTVSTINYVCSNAWLPGVPSNCGSSGYYTAPSQIRGVDVYLQHWVSPNCYINIEPGWIDLDYYVNPPLALIKNISRGYQMNQFTINPDGELSSSLQFLYTPSWAQAYKIQRISQNTLIADEITLLDGSSVLFQMNGDEVVDESDYFFGEGNDGRDCIHKSETYDYNLLKCFFQNNNQAYTADQYLSGLVATTGIARYVTKFDFQLDFTNGIYYFSLVPKPDADFSFSIQYNRCPILDNQESYNSGCLVILFYNGNEPVTLVSNNSTISVSFTNFSANILIGYDMWSVQTSGNTCFFLNCHSTSTYSLISLVTPPYQLISQSDLDLQTQVSFSINQTLAWTLETMQGVQEAVDQANRNISNLQKILESINFNITGLFPFQNLTAMRKQLQNVIDNLSNDDLSPQTTQSCSGGAWSSASCWFENFAGALILFGLAVLCLVLGYFIFRNREKVKKILGKKAPPPKMSVYSAD